MLSQPEHDLQYQYKIAVIFIFISVVIEMAAEPIYVFGQLNSFIKLKVIVDGIFMSSRCILMAIFVPKYPNEAILVFSYSQLISSVIYTICYYIFILRLSSQPFKQFMPKIYKNMVS